MVHTMSNFMFAVAWILVWSVLEAPHNKGHFEQIYLENKNQPTKILAFDGYLTVKQTLTVDN
jgi:hypothetical protein